MKPGEIPKLRKVAEKPKEVPKEEPKKVKRKVVAKPKYEELPEIPDYERPELEKYEKTDLDEKEREKAQKQLPTKTEKPQMSTVEEGTVANGLPKVSYYFYVFLFSVSLNLLSSISFFYATLL